MGIVLSRRLCAREGISQKVTGQEESRSTEKSSPTRISSSNTQDQVSYQWQTLAQARTAPSSFCAPSRHPTSMASMSYLDSCPKVWTLSRRLKRWALLVGRQRKR